MTSLLRIIIGHNLIIIIIIIIILMTIKARKPISHNVIVQLAIYSDETILLRCSKAHDTYLLKMYVRCVSVAADSEMNLHLSPLFRWGKVGLRSEE